MRANRDRGNVSLSLSLLCARSLHGKRFLSCDEISFAFNIYVRASFQPVMGEKCITPRYSLMRVIRRCKTRALKFKRLRRITRPLDLCFPPGTPDNRRVCRSFVVAEESVEKDICDCDRVEK